MSTGYHCILCHNKEQVALFRFPSKKCESRLRKWTEFCNITNAEVLPSHRLCSAHFLPLDIIDRRSSGGRVRLKSGACPSIHSGNARQRERKPRKKLCCLCGECNPDSLFFQFPQKNPVVKAEWIKFCRNAVESFEYSPHSVLCKNHFNQNEILRRGLKYILQQGAVPRFFESPILGLRHTYAAGNKCVVCGNDSHEISYFRFPKRPDIREKWLSFSGVAEENLNNHKKVCEVHFPTHMIVREKRGNAKVRLRRNAVPMLHDEASTLQPPVHTIDDIILPMPSNRITCVAAEVGREDNHQEDVFVDDVIPCSTDRVDVNSTSSATEERIGKNESNATTHSLLNSLSGSGSNIHQDPFMTQNSTLYETTPTSRNRHKRRTTDVNGDTAQDVDSVVQENTPGYTHDCITSASGNTPRKKPRYVSQVRTPDLATPRRARVNFSLARACIKKKDRVIKTLKQKLSRLEVRVRTMKQLVNHLRSQAFISTPARDNFMAMKRSSY